MRIFDARWEGTHGIGRFALEIGARLTGFRNLGLRGSPAGPLDPLRLARHLRALSPRLYFSPGYNAPLGAPCPFAFCLHDLNHLFVPENTSALKQAYYRHIIRPAVHRAGVVFTVSESSRRDICEWSGIADSSVVNVGNGVSPAFRADGPTHTAIDGPYLLYVGNDKPHKNLPRLIRAFAACSLAPELRLVATGAPGPEIRRIITSLRLTDRVSFVERVSEQRLAALYRGATALVLVSTHEGFGLPIIEAMACGTPVVTSTVTSMPEVAGDAALLVDPYDIDAIGAALRHVTTDAGLRSELRRRGLARARQYSWDETARRIVQSLRARFPRETLDLTATA